MNENICRLCYINPGVTSLFEYSSGIQIRAKIMYCCKNVQLSEKDDLPKLICASCEKELESSYNFILKCEETDKKLRSSDTKFFNGESSPKLEMKDEPEIYFPDDVDNVDDIDNINDVDKVDYVVKIDVVKDNDIDNNLYNSSKEIKEEDNLYLEPKLKRKYVRKNFKAKEKSKVLQSSICNVCSRKCQNPSTLTIHMRCHTNERPYSCRSCDKSYKDGGSLKRHEERNHLKHLRVKKFICEICGKGFFTKSDTKIHMRIHTGDTPFACAICPARFTQIASLQRHNFRHTGERTHVCTTCQKKFCTKEELKKHHLVHTTGKKFKCTTCNTLFKYKNNLRKHLRKHLEVDSFICNYCGCNFTVKGNLRVHIRKQHSSKSGYCNICSKDVPNIEMHMWKHTGERPLKCELCTSSFFDRKGLSRHMSFRHKYADKYKCTVNGCTVKVPSQQMLDFHLMKYHGNGVLYSCDKCSRGFYRKSDLTRHKSGSHKELPPES